MTIDPDKLAQDALNVPPNRIVISAGYTDIGVGWWDTIGKHQHNIKDPESVEDIEYVRADLFEAQAAHSSSDGFAVIVRTAFLESVGRYNDLFRRNPPSRVLQFSERVVMHKGRLSAKGSTATAYCWLVWVRGES